MVSNSSSSGVDLTNPKPRGNRRRTSSPMRKCTHIYSTIRYTLSSVSGALNTESSARGSSASYTITITMSMTHIHAQQNKRKLHISHTEIHPALHERHSYPTFRHEGAIPNSNPQSSIYSRAPFPDSCVYVIIYHRARDSRTNECACERLRRRVHRYRVRARVNSTHNAR